MSTLFSVSLSVSVVAVILTTGIIELIRSALPGHVLTAADWTLAAMLGIGIALLGDRLLRRIIKRIRK
jgi:hypothetical protein